MIALANVKYTRNPSLAALDKEGKRIAKHVLRLGWVGYRSNNGHLIFRAPDGVTTTAIQHDLSNPRAILNTWAPIKSWEGRVSLPLPRDKEGNLVLRCPHCSHVGENKMALVSHMTVKHSETRTCPVCEERQSTHGAYIAHLKYKHPELSDEEADEEVAAAADTEADEDIAADALEEHDMTTATNTPSIPSVPERAAFPDTVDYHNWTTKELIHAASQFPAIAEALAHRFEGQLAKIELVREALAL